MKKVFTIALLVFGVACQALAQQTTWISGSQVNFAWNAVAPIEPTDVITYQVYIKPSLTGTPSAVGAPVSGTNQLIDLMAEGRYFLCVETLRLPQGETEPIRSERMACSDVATDTQSGVPFGAMYFAAPAPAGGLRAAP